MDVRYGRLVLPNYVSKIGIHNDVWNYASLIAEHCMGRLLINHAPCSGRGG